MSRPLKLRSFYEKGLTLETVNEVNSRFVKVIKETTMNTGALQFIQNKNRNAIHGLTMSMV